MNEIEPPTAKRFTPLLVCFTGFVLLLWAFIQFCDYITDKAYNRGLNYTPASMQRAINQTRQSDSLTIRYFLEHSSYQEKSIARGFLVYLKSVKELER